MGKLRVSRKSHKRTLPSGKVTTVKKHSFNTRDKGKRGRTPKKDRWFKSEKTKLTGYQTRDSTKERHGALTKADKKYGSIKVHRKLLGLANVTPHKQAETVFRRDLKWFDEKYMNKKERRKLTAKARKARLLLGKNKGKG